MSNRSIHVFLAIVALALVGNAAAQSPQNPATGSAIVRVETDPPGASGNFTFSGVPSGTTAAGGSLTASALRSGEYAATASATTPGLVLVSISCDDGASQAPSGGGVPTRTANFRLERGEIVTCAFLYRKSEMTGENSSSGSGTQGPGAPATPGSEPGGEPGDEPENTGVAAGCVGPAMVPKAGKWNISNLPGRMVCGSMVNMPLTPSQQTGTLAIQDCGWTVVGTPMAEGDAPLTMRAVDDSGSVYTGTVGGVQDGIPMTIEFTWNLNSDEWIVGDLKSSVTQQGMTCNMTRPFELRYSGG